MGTAGGRRPAAAGYEVAVVGVTDSAGAAAGCLVAADVVETVGSAVDAPQKGFCCPSGWLPRCYFLLLWCC